MKISEKIAVSVVTYGLTTITGFLGTLYLANILGPGPLGTFALGMTIIKWLELTDLGTGGAMAKRLSEMEQEGAFLSASIVIRGVLVVIPTLAILFFSGQVNKYIGGQYAGLVSLIFLFTSIYTFAGRGLLGLNKAHLKNSTDTLERILRVVFQVALVMFGFRAIGLYWGYLSSLLISGLVAAAILFRADIRPKIPKQEHFQSLYEYAKFNWLTRLRNRSFSWIDILILGYFVTNDAVGIYQVTWNIAMTFWLVSNAISSNLFPEVSNLAAREKTERIRSLLSDGLVYAGVVPLPGLVGALLVGQDVLRMYGPEFVVGADLLIVVSGLSLFKSYEQQVLTALNSLDYPKYSFRVNLVFVFANIGLNLLLIPEFELLGAATATGIAVIVSLIYSWYLLQSIVSVVFPTSEIVRQLVAAAGMAIGVILLKKISPVSNIKWLLFVVCIGATIYFGLLFAVSKNFRTLALDMIENVR